MRGGGGGNSFQSCKTSQIELGYGDVSLAHGIIGC